MLAAPPLAAPTATSKPPTALVLESRYLRMHTRKPVPKPFTPTGSVHFQNRRSRQVLLRRSLPAVVECLHQVGHITRLRFFHASDEGSALRVHSVDADS